MTVSDYTCDDRMFTACYLQFFFWIISLGHFSGPGRALGSEYNLCVCPDEITLMYTFDKLIPLDLILSGLNL